MTGGLGIELRGVAKRFGALQVLDGIDLSVAAGEFVSLIGPSGCGKTTLLRMAAGLVEPDVGLERGPGPERAPERGPDGGADRSPERGRVDIGGGPPGEAQHTGQLAFVPQSPGLLPWRTVRANARLLSDVARRRSQRGLDPAAIDALLAEVGLGEFLQAYPHELSGGMQQRAALVRAFALDAPVLLMDEPFAALDEMTRSDMRYLLLRLWERRGATALFVTHSIAEAVMLSDRVVVMSGRPGRIDADVRIGLGRPRVPEQEETHEFFALENELRRLLRAGDRP